MLERHPNYYSKLVTIFFPSLPITILLFTGTKKHLGTIVYDTVRQMVQRTDRVFGAFLNLNLPSAALIFVIVFAFFLFVLNFEH